MTVRHLQRKGAKGSSFLYARGKAFSKPPPFPPKPPEDSLKVPNNPTRPASFLRQFRPSTAPLPALFAAKRGFFAPNARRTRPRRAPDRPVLPRRRPVFARCTPEKAPARARKGPGCPPGSLARHSPGSPQAPGCAAFAQLAPARAPPAARKSLVAAETSPAKPPPRPLPLPAARRSARPPRQGTALGQGNPDCRGRLSRFAVEKRTPQGGSDPWE